MAGKQSTKAKVIPADPLGGWYLLVTGAAYVQNIDNEPIFIVWSDTDPSTLTPPLVKEDGFVIKAEQDDNYVNDFGDTLWVWKQTHKESRVAIAMFP